MSELSKVLSVILAVPTLLLGYSTLSNMIFTLYENGGPEGWQMLHPNKWPFAYKEMFYLELDLFMAFVCVGILPLVVGSALVTYGLVPSGKKSSPQICIVPPEQMDDPPNEKKNLDPPNEANKRARVDPPDEKKRFELSSLRSRLLAVALIAIIVLGAGFNIYLFLGLRTYEYGFQESEEKRQKLSQRLEGVRQVTPKVVLDLTLTPTPWKKTVQPPYAVTFLTGHLTATNLTELMYPCILTSNFLVEYSSTNPNATINYSYTELQSVRLSKGITVVELPFGIFPLILYGIKHGDEITLLVTANVQTVWEPVGEVMSNQTVHTIIHVYVYEESS